MPPFGAGASGRSPVAAVLPAGVPPRPLSPPIAMSRLVAYLSLALVLSGTACSSKLKSALDPDLAKRLDAMRDCFPELYPFVDGLLDLAQTWRLQTPPAADPTGLTWSEQPDGSVQLAYTLSSVTISAVIRFYSPTGTMQDLDLSAATSLSEAIDAAATELATLFGTADKFMTADWTLAGATSSGSGQWTGIIGGTTNQNELEELRTTSGTPSGGPPPVAPGTVSDTGSGMTCTLTFQTASLQTDTVVDQQYPIGTINLTITNPETTVTAAIVFDGTAVAHITASDIPGNFDYQLETNSLTYNH